MPLLPELADLMESHDLDDVKITVDGAGYARLIGSPVMDDLMKDKKYYAQVEKALKSSGQTKAYNEFVKKYGKK